MSDKSAIEWTDASWNPVTGCTKVSQGCKNCYAERAWPRLQHLPAHTGRAFTDVRCHPERLEQPLRWTKPRRIFVNSMSDLFHEDVPDEFILSVFDVIRQCQNGYAPGPDKLTAWHTFQILTKRPERMRDFCTRLRFSNKLYLSPSASPGFNPMTSLRNTWLGVSVEDQATADERIPLLLQTPAAVRWISAEPLLGPVNLRHHLGLTNNHDDLRGLLNWVVCGGESGPKARSMHPDWVRSLRDQCQTSGVPFFFKQWGEYSPVGAGNPSRYIHPSKPNDGLWHKDADGVIPVWRIGKKAAGRMLDGREWNEYPA